jgi:hypothetical protein
MGSASIDPAPEISAFGRIVLFPICCNMHCAQLMGNCQCVMHTDARSPAASHIHCQNRGRI